MSEEIGKRVAEMLLRDNPSLASGRSEADLYQHLMHCLGHSIKPAVHGLNERAGAHLLTVVDRQDGFQFNLGHELTLTLRVGPYLVSLIPSRKNVENPGAMKFAVVPEPDGFAFKAIPLNPSFTTPVLSLEQFVEGLLKVACNRNFDAE